MKKPNPFTAPALLLELIIAAGLAMVFYGLYQIQPPLAFIVVGAALVAMAAGAGAWLLALLFIGARNT